MYSPGSNVGNLHFLWKVPVNADSHDVFESSQSAIEKVKKLHSTVSHLCYEERNVQEIWPYSPQIKPLALRWFYKEVSNDHPAAATTDQAEVDKRAQLAIDMEDPDIVIDLRRTQHGKSSTV